MTHYTILDLVERTGAGEGTIRRHLRNGRCPEAFKIKIGNKTTWAVPAAAVNEFAAFLRGRVGNKLPMTLRSPAQTLVINSQESPRMSQAQKFLAWKRGQK